MQDSLHTHHKRSYLPLKICSVVAASCAVLSGLVVATSLSTVNAKPDRVVIATSSCEVLSWTASLLTMNERK